MPYLCPSPSLSRRFALFAATILLAGAAGVGAAKAGSVITVGGTGAALGGMKQLAGAYTQEHPEVRIEVLPSLGSGGGIKALLASAIDLALSARPLKPQERAAGADDQAYARTRLVLATSEGTPFEGVTRDELVAFYAAKTTAWPDGTPVRLVMRPASETDTKLLRGLSPEMDHAVQSALDRPGLVVATDDQQNAETLERLPGSVGLVALGQLVSERRRLKILAIEDLPLSPDALAGNEHGLSKSFYLVTKTDTPEHARDFAAFVLSPAGQEVLAATGHASVE